MTDDTPLPFDLPAVDRKKLTVDFNGGTQSCDAMFSRVVLALLTVAAALSAGDAPHDVASFVADRLQSFGGRALRLSQPSLVGEHHFGLPN